MKPDRAVHLGRRDLQFLLHYAKLARICYDRRQRRFPLIPKCRFLHHQMLGVLKEGQLGSWILNILTFASQLSEDFVADPRGWRVVLHPGPLHPGFWSVHFCQSEMH